MTGGTEDPFEGVSATELRRLLVEAGDRRLDALSVEAAQEARREQAVLVTELQRRGEPLEEPAAPPSTSSASDRPESSAAAQEQLAATRERVVAPRPALRPPVIRADRPEERNTRSAGHSAPGSGIPS